MPRKSEVDLVIEALEAERDQEVQRVKGEYADRIRALKSTKKLMDQYEIIVDSGKVSTNSAGKKKRRKRGSTVELIAKINEVVPKSGIFLLKDITTALSNENPQSIRLAVNRMVDAKTIKVVKAGKGRVPSEYTRKEAAKKESAKK